jgi:hypothetical protein
MADPHLSTSDLIFVIRQFNYKVQEALDKRYSKKGLYGEKVPAELTSSLKNKTLLIPKGMFEEETDSVEIAKRYEYPFRLCSHEEIQTAISSDVANMAYFHYFWSDQERMFLGGVIDTHSSNILAMLRPRSVTLKDSDCLPAGTSYQNLIHLKSSQLKRLSRMIK